MTWICLQKGGLNESIKKAVMEYRNAISDGIIGRLDDECEYWAEAIRAAVKEAFGVTKLERLEVDEDTGEFDEDTPGHEVDAFLAGVDDGRKLGFNAAVSDQEEKVKKYLEE